MIDSAADTQSNMDVLVRAEKLQLLYQQSFIAVFASVISALILAVILWPVQQHTVLISWLTILFIAAFIRLLLFLR